MNRYRLAVIPGDGIGREVVPAALAVMAHVGQLTGSFALDTVEYPWSCEWYLEHERMMPHDGLEQLADCDAILLGAVGFPGVPDHVSLRGLLLPVRQAFQQYVNLRPIELWHGVTGPLRDVEVGDLDILCVRENSEGEYAGAGGTLAGPGGNRVAIQTSIFTEQGVERVVRYAFESAQTRRRTVASATKSNALQYTAVLWDDVVNRVAADYPDVTATSYHVDALAARFVSAPQSLDVVVGSNLFGDILTDLGAALQGSLGMAASANLNPERRYPSMFEPVHGSAPDIAGKGIANPIGAIWSGAMLLDHLGEGSGASMIMSALKAVAAGGPRTRDMGGTATTDEVSAAVIDALDRLDQTGVPS
jgi:tartrate dehydrogenase/decarboxylase / D-malate dehydrogenase